MSAAIAGSSSMSTELYHRSTSARISAVLGRILLALVVVIEIYPLVWIVLSSLKTPGAFSSSNIFSLPHHFYVHNYLDALTNGSMGTYLLNSVLVTVPSLAAILLLSVAAAFGIEVMRWKQKNAVLMTFLVGIMVPVQIVLLPLFTAYYKTGILDTRFALILAYTAFGLPLTIFLMTTYFRNVPYEILEASVMDGATIYQIFLRVAGPLVTNSIVTLALVQFLFVWNDLIFALTFITSNNLLTVQPGLLSFTGEHGAVQWGPTFAAICVAVIPTASVYLALNKMVIKGLTAGAIKG